MEEALQHFLDEVQERLMHLEVMLTADMAEGSLEFGAAILAMGMNWMGAVHGFASKQKE